MKRSIKHFSKQGFCIAFLTIILVGCVGVKPYEKEHLLSPLMDDGALQSLNSDFRSICLSPFERLSNSGAAGSGSSSCPTCGG